MAGKWSEERRARNAQHLADARARNAARIAEGRPSHRIAALQGDATEATPPGRAQATKRTPPPKPGTTAHNDAQPPGFKLPGHYTDESIAARNAYALPPCVELTLDEMDKRLKSPYNPFDEAAKPYVAANPDKRFAFQSPRIQADQGTRDMVPVFDKDGKQVTVARQLLYCESKTSWKFKERLNAKRAADQAVAPEESYREIMDRVARSRNNIGLQVLHDGEIMEGQGASYNAAGDVVGTSGAVQIGIRTGNDPHIVGIK